MSFHLHAFAPCLVPGDRQGQARNPQGWEGQENSPHLCKVPRNLLLLSSQSHESLEQGLQSLTISWRAIIQTVMTTFHGSGVLPSPGPHLWPAILQRRKKHNDI